MREFKLPDVGEGVAEGELLEWHVEPGDTVTEDQVVAEVETDKAVVDVPSPVNGTVRELHADPGEVVPVGTVIITFDEDGDAGASGGAEAEGATGAEGASSDAEASDDDEGDAVAEADAAGNGQTGGRVFAPPSARRLARELDVDIATVEGSGPGGRVTEADVRAAADGQSGDGAAGSDDGATAEGEDGLKSAVSTVDDGETVEAGDGEAAAGPDSAGRERTLAAPATRRVAEELDVDIDDVPASEERDGEPFVDEAAVREYAQAQQEAQAADAREVERSEASTGASGESASPEHREPYRGVRKTIGEAMERSKFTAPHVTHHETVDATALVEAREKLKPRAEEEGVRLTYLPFVMKAVVAALQEHPVLNTALDEENEEIVYRNYYDIGVATATDAGLMVPVVEGVDDKGLLEIAESVSELTAKARDRSIAREQLRGSTFTVTNFGAIGGEYATPIINYPETAILGLGAIEQRPAVHDGEVVARHTLPLSLSVDHRVVDGADAARFVDTLGTYLEEPTLLLLE